MCYSIIALRKILDTLYDCPDRILAGLIYLRLTQSNNNTTDNYMSINKLGAEDLILKNKELGIPIYRYTPFIFSIDNIEVEIIAPEELPNNNIINFAPHVSGFINTKIITTDKNNIYFVSINSEHIKI